MTRVAGRSYRARLLALLAFGLLLGAATQATPAVAQTGNAWWRITTTAAPTSLPPGGQGQLALTVINVGNGDINAAGEHVTITDHLPAGLEATSARGSAGSLLQGESVDFHPGKVTCTTQPSSVACTFAGPKPLIPFIPLEVAIAVKVAANATSGAGEVTTEGGGAKAVSVPQNITVGGGETPFGLQSYSLTAENEGGSIDTQAGTHPYQLTTSLALNERYVPDEYEKLIKEGFEFVPKSAAQVKDLL
ncbi:MAG: hypothetical protein ACYDHT_11905, partial [Solirubrobacteraceae bacterium]